MKAVTRIGVALAIMFVILVYLTRKEPPTLKDAYAISEVRAVRDAELSFARDNGGMFTTLPCLADPTACGFSTGAKGYLPTELVGLPSVRHGYEHILLVMGSPSARTPNGFPKFVYEARPVGNIRGLRSFAADHSGRICWAADGAPVPRIPDGLAADCAQVAGSSIDPTR